MEPKPLFGALRVYRERGVYLRRLEQFVKAKAACDVGYESAPDDVRLLITRSQVCSDAVKPQQAYADAELALKLEPTNMNARKVQANALYTMSDFERSIVMNYRGQSIRKQPPYFTEGISQGIETIEDCIGKRAGDVMLDFYPLIKQQVKLRSAHDSKLKTHVSRIPKMEVTKRVTQREARKHGTLARVLAMKYLGSMAYDKFFLQQLDKDSRIMSANSKGSKQLQVHIKEALETLTERQEMLRTQRPYYTIKRAEQSESRYLTKYRKATLQNDRKVDAYNAERLLKQIDHCLRENRIMDLIAKAERMQIFLDSKSQRTLPDKQHYIDRLYRAVGEGYLSLFRLSYRHSERHNQRRIAFLMGMPIGRPSSYDSVVAKFPYKFLDLKKATENLLEQLEMCENPYMKCWIMFELSWIMNKQKNYPRAKFYAKRCQAQAEDIGSTTWWLNACFMLMSGDMQQRNTHEVLAEIEEAYSFAANLPFPEQVQAFLLKCATVASSTSLGDENKANRDRQRQILKVMDEQTRTDTRVLFKRMSTVPAGRQFAVLPRQQQLLATEPERRKQRQRGLSVVPGVEQPVVLPPVSQVLGYQKFDY